MTQDKQSQHEKFWNCASEQVILYGDAVLHWWKEKGSKDYLDWAEKQGIKYIKPSKENVVKPVEEEVRELAEYVWVVGDCWTHEGYTILGIFDSEEAAKTFKSLEETEEDYPLESRDAHWVSIERFKLHRRQAK